MCLLLEIQSLLCYILSVKECQFTAEVSELEFTGQIPLFSYIKFIDPCSLVYYLCVFFYVMTSERSGHDGDDLAAKSKIYSLVLYRKGVLTPGLGNNTNKKIIND